ncbi:MAG: glycosyltransferase [Acidaminococcaceae bacterium]
MNKEPFKPKVMLHYILPPNTGGPNKSMERLEKSWLNKYYYFGKLVQNEKPGKTLNFRLLKSMINQVKAFEPDIVHISGLQSAGFYAVLAAKIGGCNKIITTVHGSTVDAIEFNPLLKKIFQYVIEPLTIILSSKVYTVCYDMSNKFRINKRKNFAGVIHNPAPLIEQNQIRDYYDYRKIIGIDYNSTVVTYVGRMTYDKGISYIIDAIKQIKNLNIVFIFVGDGPYYDIVNKELAKEIDDRRVFVLGKRNDVLKWLAISDIFLFATLHENLSNALLEACAVGLSIIATNVGGNKEIISNEVNGLLIPPKDSNAIAETVNYLHKNKDKMRSYGFAAKENVENNFSQESIYVKVKQLYERTLWDN